MWCIFCCRYWFLHRALGSVISQEHRLEAEATLLTITAHPIHYSHCYRSVQFEELSQNSFVETVFQNEHDIFIDWCYVIIQTYLNKQNKVKLRMVTQNTHLFVQQCLIDEYCTYIGALRACFVITPFFPLQLP